MTAHFTNPAKTKEGNGPCERMRPCDGDFWYIARVRPGKLAIARQNLARQKYRTFSPMRQTTRRRGTQLSQTIQPLFPGYLFVQVPSDNAKWTSINSTYGVARLVALERNMPTKVPAGLMRTLFDACEGELWTPRAEDFLAGTKVRILSGPFAEVVARVEEVPDHDRIYVLLDLMGRVVRLMLTPRELECI